MSFVDEGTEKVLDIFQQSGAVNTLFLAIFTYGRGIAGRQVPGQPLPDHGKQEYDTDSSRRQLRGRPSAVLQGHRLRPEDTRAPDFGSLDVLAERPARGPQARHEDHPAGSRTCGAATCPASRRLQEKWIDGTQRPTALLQQSRTTVTSCSGWSKTTRAPTTSTASCGAPSARAPSANALGASHGGEGADRPDHGCFCEFCESKARKRGIDSARAKEGFRSSSSSCESARR